MTKAANTTRLDTDRMVWWMSTREADLTAPDRGPGARFLSALILEMGARTPTDDYGGRWPRPGETRQGRVWSRRLGVVDVWTRGELDPQPRTAPPYPALVLQGPHAGEEIWYQDGEDLIRQLGGGIAWVKQAFGQRSGRPVERVATIHRDLSSDPHAMVAYRQADGAWNIHPYGVAGRA
jgi:hypothetical protein